MADQQQLRPCRVVMCGRFNVVVAGERVPLVRVQKACELLALLSLHLGRADNRDEIVELLWPGVDPSTGRNRLRFTLSTLRNMLEPLGVPRGSVIIAGRNQIAVSGDAISTDVSDMQFALRRATGAADPSEKAGLLAEALQCCNGEFMAGYYADWIETDRKHIASQFVDAACALAEILQDAGDFDGALNAALKAVGADPWREEAHRSVLRAHMARGEAAEARRHFSKMERAFRTELGVDPGPETRKLLTDVGGAHTAGSLRSDAGLHGRAASPTSSSGESTSAGASADGDAPLVGRRRTLPVYFTKFLGRESELDEVIGLLDDRSNRLTTLTGLGGIGKTRLAVEAGQSYKGGETNPPLYVDLLTCSRPSMLFDAIAAACGLRSLLVRPAFERIVEHFSAAPALLILDNFEHLLPEGASLVQSLMEEVESLSCLVTSRLALEVAGEVEFPVGPMDVPPTAQPTDMSRSASVQLFLHRARLVKPDFSVTERNAADIAHICRTLEGIPLALELAAAWSASLSPGQMKERLGRPMELLVSHRAGFQERHRALRTVLDQSFSLLPLEAKDAFVCLSAFRATWTAEAAEAVCGGEALSWLDLLRRRSLVVSIGATDRMRFRMLEPVREYAWECLDEARRAESAARHAKFYHDLGQTAREYLDGPDAEDWLTILAAEEPNIVAALDWCLDDQRDPDTGVGLAEALRGLWEMRGYEAERCRWMMTRLARVAGPTPLSQARALGCASYMARLQGDFRQALRLLEHSVALFRESGDDVRLGFNICLLGQLAQHTGDGESARALHRESLAILRRIDHEWGVAMALSSTGKTLAIQGRYDEARPLIIESLEEFRRMGDSTAVATVLTTVALIEYAEGSLDASRALEEESLEIRRTLNRPWGIAYSLTSLGRVCLREGSLAQCRALVSEGGAIFDKIGDLWGIAYARHYMGIVAHLSGDSSACRLLGEALRYRQHAGIPGEIAETLEAIASARSISDPGPAVQLIEAAAALRRRAGVPVPPVERRDLASAVSDIKSALGDEAYATAVAIGQQLDTEGAIASALHLCAAPTRPSAPRRLVSPRSRKAS